VGSIIQVYSYCIGIPDKFRGTLTAAEAGAALPRLRVPGSMDVREIPLADGGGYA